MCVCIYIYTKLKMTAYWPDISFLLSRSMCRIEDLSSGGRLYSKLPKFILENCIKKYVLRFNSHESFSNTEGLYYLQTMMKA